MRSNPEDVPPSVDFPDELEPTSKGDREQCTKFSTTARKSERQIGEELERFDVDRWFIDDAPLSSGDSWPGYVVRWEKEGQQYALVSDAYTSKKANARAAYFWIKETRKRMDRPVTTAQEALAAAALESGRPQLEGEINEPTAKALDPETEPKRVLGLHPHRGYSDSDITDAYRDMAKEYHPDSGQNPDETMFKKIQTAKEVLLDEQ